VAGVELMDENKHSAAELFYQPDQLLLYAKRVLPRRFELHETLLDTQNGVFVSAFDHSENRAITLKLFPEILASDKDSAGRILTEVQRSLRLSHANTWSVRVLDRVDDLQFLCLDRIDGKPLLTFIGTNPKPKFAETVLVQCLLALCYAHKQKVLHGDIRPASILIDTDNKVTLIDFGVSRTVTEMLTRVTNITPSTGHLYSAPEFIRGKSYSRASEFYSLACIMYELLTGDPPFLVGNLAHQHIHENPQPLDKSVVSRHPFVSQFIDLGLIKDPDKRIDGLHDMLTQVASNTPRATASLAGFKKGVRSKRAKRLLPRLSLLLVPIFLIAVAIWFAVNAYEEHRLTELRRSLGLQFAIVARGEFEMGDRQAASDANNPWHPVSITREFYISMHETTIGQYMAFLNNRHEGVSVGKPDVPTTVVPVGDRYVVSAGTDPSLPVTEIGWESAMDYCRWLSGLSADSLYILPTEAQWEFAARDGSVRKYPQGDEPPEMNCAGTGPMPVGRHKHTRELYNICANVSEWVFDFYDPDYFRSPENSVDPIGPPSGNSHVVRGGSYLDSAAMCEIHVRRSGAQVKPQALGFRVIRVPRADTLHFEDFLKGM